MKPSVELQNNWVFKLGPGDSALVLKALGGRLRPEEVQAARELGDMLTEQRARQATHLMGEMKKHAGAIERDQSGTEKSRRYTDRQD